MGSVLRPDVPGSCRGTQTLSDKTSSCTQGGVFTPLSVASRSTETPAHTFLPGVRVHPGPYIGDTPVFGEAAFPLGPCGHRAEGPAVED